MIYKFMNEAIALAESAGAKGNVPVGAVVTFNNEIIAKGENGADAVSHAELEAIRTALMQTGGRNLSGCDIYVTLEPCPMCAGAILNAGIKNIYFGAYDSSHGACGSADNLPARFPMICKTRIFGGIYEEKCRRLIKDYFTEKRKSQCE